LTVTAAHHGDAEQALEGPSATPPAMIFWPSRSRQRLRHARRALNRSIEEGVEGAQFARLPALAVEVHRQVLREARRTLLAHS
jgi:hypothetical protein